MKTEVRVSRDARSSLTLALELSVNNEVSTCMCNEANHKKSSLAMLSLEIAILYQILGSRLGDVRRAGVEESTEKFILHYPNCS